MRKMWLFLLGVCFFGGLSAETSSNYFCADMNPQHHVMIDQLMGMWFGVEIINHQDQVFHTKTEFSCPIIHISEDREATSTYNPLYRDYNYGYNYGRGKNINNIQGYHIKSHIKLLKSSAPIEKPWLGESLTALYTNASFVLAHDYGRIAITDRPIPAYTDRNTVNEIRRKVYEQAEYDRQTTYGNYPSIRKQRLYDLKQTTAEVKFLRVIWDENGESIEYRVRYNVSKSGFWISSGPENGGASLDPHYSHFGGVIQVLKAVGNHMVLTFCHQLPNRELYSILLSRELNLENVEIHGVHNMLNRKGLRTNSVKRTCSGSSKNRVDSLVYLVSLLMLPLLTYKF